MGEGSINMKHEVGGCGDSPGGAQLGGPGREGLWECPLFGIDDVGGREI